MTEAALKSKNVKTETALPPLVIDAQTQTKTKSRKNKYCQTIPDVKKEKVDFEVQASLQPEKNTTGTQTIKEENQEIAMQNRPSSNSSNQSKKRKLSATQPSPQLIAAIGSISNRSAPNTSPISEEKSNEKFSSDVYKIYRHVDPNEAKKQIKRMKNCHAFIEPTKPMPKKENLETAFASFFTAIWQERPPSMEQIVTYILYRTAETQEKMKAITIPLNDDPNEAITISTLLLKSYTMISMIQPKGFEWWFIKDYGKGPKISEWYRGYSCKSGAAFRIAQLNAMGFRIPATTERLKKISWFDFAEDFFRLPSPGILCQKNVLKIILNRFHNIKRHKFSYSDSF